MSSQNEDIPYFLFIVLLQCLFLNQVFCNLYRIQCSAFLIWSPTIQNVNPFSLLRSLRIRPT